MKMKLLVAFLGVMLLAGGMTRAEAGCFSHFASACHKTFSFCAGRHSCNTNPCHSTGRSRRCW